MKNIEQMPGSEDDGRVIALEQKVLEGMFTDGNGGVDESRVVDFVMHKEEQDAERLREITTRYLHDDTDENEKVSKIIKEFSEVA